MHLIATLLIAFVFATRINCDQLSELRALIRSESIDVLIVDMNDRQGTEFVNEHDKRIKFISGFTGSYGTALISQVKALLFTDGRYWTQAAKQLQQGWTLIEDTNWIGYAMKEHFNSTSKLAFGFDPWTTKFSSHQSLREKLPNATLKPIANLIDRIWIEQPNQVSNPIVIHPVEFAGATWQSKVCLTRKDMKSSAVESLVVTQLDSIAWLLNLRGNDTAAAPEFFSFLILSPNETAFFVNESCFTPEVYTQLAHGGFVHFYPYDYIEDYLRNLVATTTGKIWISSDSSFALGKLVPNERAIREDAQPITKRKAIKNRKEKDGMRKAGIAESLAIVKYISWLSNSFSVGSQYEFDALSKLEDLRTQYANYKYSTPAISASGSNGAIIHYAPTKENQSFIDKNEVYLLDVTAQYLEGTTDISRTFHFGTPKQEEKECFTYALKGHIAVAMAIFPNGTDGFLLDGLARQSLWQAGIEFAHSTGHGIGSYLEIHEPGAGIAPRCGLHKFQPGMVVTIEPGCYFKGKFGVRHESMFHVKQVETKFRAIKQNTTQFLGFESLTFVPFDRNLMDFELLERKEIDWLNSYNKQCFEILHPLLVKKEGDEIVTDWLANQCKPL